MRISDGSPDVCSSDLGKLDILGLARQAIEIEIDYQFRRNIVRDRDRLRHRLSPQPIGTILCLESYPLGPAVAVGTGQGGLSRPEREPAVADRKTVVSGTSVTACDYLGGRRLNN